VLLLWKINSVAKKRQQFVIKTATFIQHIFHNGLRSPSGIIMVALFPKNNSTSRGLDYQNDIQGDYFVVSLHSSVVL
jgi:hypothetical protein